MYHDFHELSFDVIMLSYIQGLLLLPVTTGNIFPNYDGFKYAGDNPLHVSLP